MSVEMSNTRNDLMSLAKEVDIKVSLLYRWRKGFSGKLSTSFPEIGKVISTAAGQKLALVKKELLEKQMDRDILKMAVSIFSKNDSKYSG
ncbi:hypothetical protein [Chryseobacterium sp.]|uniref:hypothetical protein n=1 Tax=Chryseobacterium sp. TaxID=1871047 RepID=UPI000ECF3D4C|nr:hypothetical protein [Chryseobacterium sp.]HCA06136.1 hypothetical protein [Chryseobacterium sp.]